MNIGNYSGLLVWRTGTNCEEGLHSKRIVTHRIQEVRDDSFTKQRGPGMGRAESAVRFLKPRPI